MIPKIRTIFLCGLLVVTNTLGFATESDKEASMNKITVRIAEVSPSGKVAIQLVNSSPKTVRIWKESNSWGAARWRILLVRKGLVQTFFQNPDQDFTVNMANFDELASGANIRKSLDLNGGNWCGLGHCGSFNEHGFGGQLISFEPGDLIIVIYDVPFSPECLKMGVWYGVAASSTSFK